MRFGTRSIDWLLRTFGVAFLLFGPTPDFRTIRELSTLNRHLESEMAYIVGGARYIRTNGKPGAWIQSYPGSNVIIREQAACDGFCSAWYFDGIEGGYTQAGYCIGDRNSSSKCVEGRWLGRDGALKMAYVHLSTKFAEQLAADAITNQPLEIQYDSSAKPPYAFIVSDASELQYEALRRSSWFILALILIVLSDARVRARLHLTS